MGMRTPVSSPTNTNYRSRMVTCFTCGLPSSKEWAHKVSTRPNAPDRPYFPFLAQIKLPLGVGLEADGSTVVCAFCHASLLAQWRHFEQQSACRGNQAKIPRVYSLGKFICGVCCVTTYRKRVRTLPVEKFPFLLSQRPHGSMTFGNNRMALVCLDCYETLQTQNEEYDRWGFPLQKRRFNWLARPPPHPNSAEASVARLPCGKIKIPSCPPTEPSINPFISTDNRLANTTDVSTNCQSSSQIRTAAAASGSKESGSETRRRKLAAVYTDNPFIDSAVKVQSPQSGTEFPLAGSRTPWQGKHKATPTMPIPSRPEIIYKRTQSSPSSTQRCGPQCTLSVIASDMICPTDSIRGSAQCVSLSIPHGSVFAPDAIYRPRRKPLPFCGRRHSSALSLYTSAGAPFRVPVITTVKSCDSSRKESSSSIRVSCPKSSTVPWAHLQKFSASGDVFVKRRRFSQTETPECEPCCTRRYSDSSIVSHGKYIQPLQILHENSNEQGFSEPTLSDLANRSASAQPVRPLSSECRFSHSSVNPQEIITQKMEQAASTGSHSKSKEPLRYAMTSGHEKGIPIRKRRTGYDLAEPTAEEGSRDLSYSSSGTGQLMIDVSDGGVVSTPNCDKGYCAIDLSIKLRKRSSTTSDPSVPASGGICGGVTTKNIGKN